MLERETTVIAQADQLSTRCAPEIVAVSSGLVVSDLSFDGREHRVHQDHIDPNRSTQVVRCQPALGPNTG